MLKIRLTGILIESTKWLENFRFKALRSIGIIEEFGCFVRLKQLG